MEHPIDFVLPWVDDSDPSWLESKQRYSPPISSDSSARRFRDWDNLQFWFRGVERYAPWVRKIHFITCGHVPKWLNLRHPQINFVKHSDYIPSEYLPTFSSHAILMNLHRIKDIADHFVVFNDDFFPLNNLKPTDFYVNGVPCDQALMRALVPKDDIFASILFNNMRVINRRFQKRTVLKKHFFKWFNLKYGFHILRNFAQCLERDFSDFHNPHLTIAYKKGEFTTLWSEEGELLHETCLNKFRSRNDVSDWLFRYWRVVKGEFNPSPIIGQYYELSNDESANAKIFRKIQTHGCKILAINDVLDDIRFEQTKNDLIQAFLVAFPHKSSFEL